ncbi:MAG: hypothetical protein HY761_07390 [Candidatus Omnitrophica bacterium]|nr:hypothetical protein [Candidatus Omnitrophota bacterium]
MKYTNEICGKGGTPDLNKATEGLPENDRLRISQKTNAVLFDGVDPNLKQENLTNVSGTLPSLTGKDGKITDLKSYDPTIKTVTASANTAPPPLSAVAASNTAVKECKYTGMCPVSQGEINAINTLIKNKKEYITWSTNNAESVRKDCLAKPKFCAKYNISPKFWQDQADEAKANLECYEKEKTSMEKCRQCPDGSWSDAEERRLWLS